jgi:hypothetical protein
MRLTRCLFGAFSFAVLPIGCTSTGDGASADDPASDEVAGSAGGAPNVGAPNVGAIAGDSSATGGSGASATMDAGRSTDAAPSTQADATSIADWPTDAGTKGGPFQWVGIIGTGQSLGVGCQSAAQSTTQPFKNVMLRDQGPDPKYPTNGAATAQWSLVPLVEPIRLHVPGYATDDPQYPNNICITDGSYGETPHAGFANTLSALWAARGNGDYITAHSVVARGGACLAQINKLDSMGGGRTYAAGIAEARVFKKLADQAGRTYGVAAVLLTHGECDSQNPPFNPMYGAQLYQLWSDYNADIKGVTGQARDIVVLASQQSGLPASLGGPNVQLWRAGNEHPGQIVCTGPKYAYGDYGVHLPGAPAYERLGEKYAEVFDYVVNRGAPWKPVGPSKITRSGAVITLTFDVPSPPLVWDSHLVSPHQTMHTAWAKGRGFEVIDGASNEIAIASIEIRGNDVVLTLASAPAQGTAFTVAYALTQDGGGWLGGYGAGMHGLLRDSDTFAGYSTEMIDVTVKNGSAVITAGANAFSRRAYFDIVTGAGVPDDTVVTAVTSTQITLSTPWTGTAGNVKLSFHHNHYNYGVHFAMPVP